MNLERTVSRLEYDLAANPIQDFACPDGRLIDLVRPMIWVQIFLHLQRDFKTRYDDVEVDVVDVSLLHELLQMEDRQLKQLAGLGKKSREKLKLILAYAADCKIWDRDGQVFDFESV